MNYVLTPTAVRKLRRVLAPTPGNTGAGGAPTTIHPDDFPPPFTVRWSQSQTSGQGAWVIWLPDISQLVMYDTDYVTPSGVSAASALPSGWYTVDDVENDDEEVWLVLHTPDDPQSTTPVSAEFTNAEGQATTGESVTNLLIAQMETDETTGARRVKQFVDSAVVIGGASGGETITLDDVSTDLNDDDEVEIKNWEDGTPASSTTIAQDINNPPSNPSALVERDHNGELKYKGLGTLAQLTGSYVTGEVTKTVVTNIEWNETNHTLDITKATVVIKDGTVKSWTEGQPAPIPTTAISSILPQQGGGS